VRSMKLSGDMAAKLAAVWGKSRSNIEVIAVSF